VDGGGGAHDGISWSGSSAESGSITDRKRPQLCGTCCKNRKFVEELAWRSFPDQLKSEHAECIVQHASPLAVGDLHNDGLAGGDLSMVLEHQVKLAIRIKLCKSGGLIGVNVADLAVDNLEPTFSS
jgi:hypothetical protein